MKAKKEPILMIATAYVALGLTIALVGPWLLRSIATWESAPVLDEHRRSLVRCAWFSTMIHCIALAWRSDLFWRRFPIAAHMMNVTWRLMATCAVAFVSAATKWNDHNFFCICLVGCYFLFVLLESVFSFGRTRNLSS